MKKLIICTAFLILLGAASAGTLTLERTIPLPGVDGRIDHFGIDVDGGRLFVAALGNQTVEVVDFKQGKAIRSLAGIAEPQGIFYLREFKRLCVASAGDGTLRFFDGTSYELTSSLTLGEDADNVRYDATAKQILVGYGKESGGLAIVDAATGKTVADIPLSAHAESFQLEKSGVRVFVNVPRSKQIAVVDRQQKKVVATWPVTSAGGNFPMALDEATHRLFIGCRTPARLLVLDTESGTEVAQVDLHGDCDDLFFDAARHQLYASCGEGFIDVFTQKDADHCALKESVATVAKARTCFFDGRQIFLAVPKVGARDAEVRIYDVH
jgi:DNA-binding beta-propeller fold protein YncE